ncbi:MAG: dihydrofolate reductase [Rhodospirillaceae bacterium]|jgi:dihydrofolate reductase|nr:dihydrofolate reductase [Rhodospirillales bacterium]MBT3905671.1 dihydrofolate reductase [Rhodospirillaceae bacterium]MBT4699846.1 dihydrofolate reductase [Rhodospirillaceae bacterium]MBT5034877.1 dihydrofolate reductase [Rhodospirillaceae bacterium]MBT6219505.1 dihydrofolate reductase [Rhodospirillaceae bacterium]
MRISIIVAMGENRVIGFGGTMPWHIPGDLKYFKEKTMGKPVIMGRRTFQSIGKPLPGRTNIILSRDQSFYADGVTIAHDRKEALAVAEQAIGGDDEIMIIGGAKVYTHFAELTERIYLTQIHAKPDGDTFFHDFDLNQWVEFSREDHDGDPSYSFIVLDRPPT